MVAKFVYESTKIDPEKVADWLQLHWKDKRCPICKSNDWSISEKALQLREWTRSSIQIPSVEVVAKIHCLVCGNVIFIDPFVADLFEDAPEHLRTSSWETKT
jgi:hypothetical protein